MKSALYLWAAVLLPAAPPDPVLWKFDRPGEVGGYRVEVSGRPRTIGTPAGKAIVFNGIDDALFVDVHPLAGAETWTWETIFRPDSGGNPAQRFFHLQENGSQTRMLFEIRIVDGRWCLDSYAQSAGIGKTLIDRGKLHPLGVWHAVAAVYDGREFRNYVDGVLEGQGEVRLAPQGPGRTSVGVRINRVDYFKGAILESRFTRRALEPREFRKVPPSLVP